MFAQLDDYQLAIREQGSRKAWTQFTAETHAKHLRIRAELLAEIARRKGETHTPTPCDCGCGFGHD